MSAERRARVLRAIVEDYVSTQDPVGSKALVERHKLDVSPATVRNDMAQLEREGLIVQPHASAGRVPTDKGYREFVDHIEELNPLSPAERRAIATVLEGPIDLDSIVDRSVRLLAQLTHQVAVMQYPALSSARVRHVELVELGPSRCLAVLITDEGRVEQRIVDVSPPPGAERAPGHEFLSGIARVKHRVNELLDGALVNHVGRQLRGLERALPAADAELARSVALVLEDIARGSREERVVMAGTANLARAGSDFGESIGPLLEAFEEQVVLLRLLASMADDAQEVSVRIGEENAHRSFATSSVISTGYGTDTDSGARIAVLGPTRMDYPGTIAAVRSVAKYVTDVLDRRR